MSDFNQYSEDAIRTAGEGNFLETTKLIDALNDLLIQEDLEPEVVDELMSRLLKASEQDEHKVGLMYDALGLAGEAGEVADYIKKVMGHGKPFDQDHVEKELGDVLWYINRMTRRLGSRLLDIANKNIAKLKARYPDGFSHAASEGRKT